jgi:hypothetical protein
LDARPLGFFLSIGPLSKPLNSEDRCFPQCSPILQETDQGAEGGMGAALSFKGHLGDKRAEALVPKVGVIGSVDMEKVPEAREKG